MLKKTVVFLVAMFAVAVFLVPMSAQAQLGKAVTNLDQATKGTELSSDLTGTTATVIKVLLSLLGTVFLLLTIYAGILWMTAHGKDEQVEEAQKILRAAVFGLIIVMLAYAFTFFVTSKLGKAGGNAETGGASLAPQAGSDEAAAGIKTEAECTKAGGHCWNNPGGNYTNVDASGYDPNDPCDPDLAGDYTPQLGWCEGSNNPCCTF